MSGAAPADSTLVTADVIATWHNLPRAVEVGGDTYYGCITNGGAIAVVAIT